MDNEEKLASLIEESIKLELNVADLYFLYHRIFPEDADFWWQLTLEEKNHAALIRSGREKFFPLGIFPEEMVADNLQKLQEMNRQVEDLVRNHRARNPSRRQALNTAYKLENSAGEIHYQNFIQKSGDSELDRIFKDLNQDDRDHAVRISAYMREQQVEFDRREQ